MSPAPSNDDLQQLVIDLCRANFTLRLAESRGGVLNGAECAELANGIDRWLNICERQIAAILRREERTAPPAFSPNGRAGAELIDFSEARAARGEAAPFRADAAATGEVVELESRLPRVG